MVKFSVKDYLQDNSDYHRPDDHSHSFPCGVWTRASNRVDIATWRELLNHGFVKRCIALIDVTEFSDGTKQEAKEP